MSEPPPGGPRGGAVVLAAGFGRRFGSDKRRHALPDGTRLLFATLRRYATAFAEVVVVLRPEDRDLAEDVGDADWDARVEVVFCADARLGMGHSLACGARAAAERGWDWLFVALGDMAWVQPATLAALHDALASADGPAIVQPLHDGEPGHPVGFSRDYLPSLVALRGDQGARPLVRDAGDALIRVPVVDAGVLEDLDTPPAVRR